MKTSLAFGSALALLLVAGVSSAATHKLAATLTGAAEVPPVTTTATGTASLTFDDVTNKVSGEVTFKDLHDNGNNNLTQTCTASHIHSAAAGANGPAIVSFTCAASKITFTDLAVPPGEVANLLSGKTYVNVHSPKYGSGEIRGQLLAAIVDGGAEGGVDSGADAGASSSSGSSGTSGTSGTSGGASGGTSGSNGATTTPVDAGTSEGEVSADDGGGCTTSGNRSKGDGLAIAGLAGLGLALVVRSRKNKKR